MLSSRKFRGCVFRSKKLSRVVSGVFLFEQIADPFGTDNPNFNMLNILKIWGVKMGSQFNPALGRKHMAHNNSNEYQIKIVHHDGTEELSGWMDSTEQVAEAMIMAHKPQGATFWLMVRNPINPDYSDNEQILEYPIMNVPSPQCMPHDSRYLELMGSKSRYSLGFSASLHKP